MPAEKILVVDDDPQIRTLLKDRLEAHDYRVYQAENGIHGLEIAEIENPDLILLDLQMPEMDGMEMLERLKVEFPDIMVVVLSTRQIVKIVRHHD